MININPQSKLRELDDVKQIIFDDIIVNFNKKFKRNIDKEDIFIVAETQQEAIITALERGNDIRCIYLGTFKVAPNLVELAELRRQFIISGYNPQDAHFKAVQQMDTILLEKYNEAVKINKFGKETKHKIDADLYRNKRANKRVNLPFNPLSK